MLGLPAVAVDKEMVGRDSDAELIGGATGLGWKLPLAAWRADWADGSDLDLGDVEKSWVKRFGLDVEALMAIPPFPEVGEKEGGLEESLAKEGEVADRRGIAGKD
jgi:2-hydroxychromene-2-carboxylate isomerase